jgi:hypothetical protein
LDIASRSGPKSVESEQIQGDRTETGTTDKNARLEEAHNAIREGQRLIADTTKQLAILSSGSIIILGTFLKNVFPDPSARCVLISALVFLAATLIAAALAMAFFPISLIRSGVVEEQAALSPRFGEEDAGLTVRFLRQAAYHVSTWAYWLSLLFFCCGVILFAVFIILNL